MKLRNLFKKKDKKPKEPEIVVIPKEQQVWEIALANARATLEAAKKNLYASELVQTEMINLALRKIREIKEGVKATDKKDIKKV